MSAYYELTDDQLLALPTNRLYTIYKIYRAGHLTLSGYEDDFTEHDRMISDRCDLIKAELDKRGHIPRKHNPNGANVENPFSSKRSWWTCTAEEPVKPKQGSIKNYEDAIGLQVYKNSKKPFKSKNIYNTVKAVTTNPHTHLPAFAFEEDNSIVDANICSIRKVK